MTNELSKQECIWIAALEKLRPKIKSLGWRIDKSRCIEITEANTAVYPFLDKGGNRHRLCISANGTPFFQPSRMTCF